MTQHFSILDFHILASHTTNIEEEVKNENWNKLLKRLRNHNSDIIIENISLLLDSLRSIRNEIIHHDYNPTSEDLEFSCHLY